MTELMPPMHGALRKIIHIDMDAFFASVEQRDDPTLRGRPIAVGGGGPRGVVAAASYEARAFGVRSAMPGGQARRLCADLVFVPPRFEAYRAASAQIRAIFDRFTDLVQPLSLDEAYLDVTDNRLGIRSATYVAQEIRRLIFEQTGLTASAGVSFNKLLAKLASDQNKPDGLCVIRPEAAEAFVAALPVRSLHGIGPVTARRMATLGIQTGADLRACSLAMLRQHFGKAAEYYFGAARGLDDRPVRIDEVRKSISVEDTFATDLRDSAALTEQVRMIADRLWQRVERAEAQGRTITLKVKFADFRILTRSRSLSAPVRDRALLTETACQLLADQVLPVPAGVRLLGLGLGNLEQDAATEPPARQLSLAI